MKRNSYIDFLRIIACLMVIGTHLKLPWLINNSPSIIRIIVSCFVADGVAIFWMIMGIYYFRNITYRERVKKLLKKIVFPLIISSIIIFYFYEYICNSANFIESIRHTKEQYLNILKEGLLLFQNAIDGAEYLWYLYIYILIVLLYPFLEKIKELFDQINYKKTILGFFTILAFNDISSNRLLEFSHHTFNAVLPSLIFLYTGYLLAKNQKKTSKKSILICLIFFSIFLFSNIIRSFFIYKNCLIDPTNRELVKWYTSFSLISIISLYYFAYYLFKNVNSCIACSHIGKLTFYIYLVHYMVIAYFNGKGFNQDILKFGKNSTSIYQIIYMLIVFIISMIISEILLLISIFIKKLKYSFNNNINRKETIK